MCRCGKYKRVPNCLLSTQNIQIVISITGYMLLVAWLAMLNDIGGGELDMYSVRFFSWRGDFEEYWLASCKICICIVYVSAFLQLVDNNLFCPYLLFIYLSFIYFVMLTCCSFTVYCIWVHGKIALLQSFVVCMYLKDKALF